MIISASRRTDIPAFYTPWFMNRIREQYLLTRNPFNANQVKKVSLHPDEVDLIVFWTRNPARLMKHLPELEALRYRYYFQYTITGYPRTLERSVPSLNRATKTFLQLSDQIGPEKVVWRYDPVLLSNQVDIQAHKRLFATIAKTLSGATLRVVISFADFYRKTQRNLNQVGGLIYSDIREERERLIELANYLYEISDKYGMEIKSCAEPVDLSASGIPHGKCIDDQLIKDVFGLEVSAKKDKNQREECGCIKSVDIGAYNTCLHGCTYCYATFNKNSALTNRERHDRNSPFLIGAR